MPGSARSRCIMAGFIKTLIFICYLCSAICHLSLGVSLKEPRLVEDLDVHNTRSHDALSSDARVSLVIDHLCFKSQMSGSAWSKSIAFMYDVRNSLLKIIMQMCWSAVRVSLIKEYRLYVWCQEQPAKDHQANVLKCCHGQSNQSSNAYEYASSYARDSLVRDFLVLQ